MNRLFNPDSVVVIGVSESKKNLGRYILSNLIEYEYQGKIYAVGSHDGEVLGIPLFSSIEALPIVPDVAAILTPSHAVPNVLAQCGEKGIPFAIIESGGFGEHGAEGKSLETEMVQISRRYGMRFVGPNCIGMANTANGFYTPFSQLPNPYKKGSIAVFAQSGGIGLPMADRLSANGIGISKVVTMGNKIDLDEADYLEYIMEDPDTSAAYFYLEDFKRGGEFAELARRCHKPIILHKSNTSSLSRTIAQSHTAALAVDDSVVDAICEESGVLRVRSMAQAVNLAKGLCLPELRGKNLGVISRSGGHAVISADSCAKYDFHLPPFDKAVLDEAARHARTEIIQFGNPLDLGNIAHLSYFTQVVEKTLFQENIHGVVFIQVSQMALEQHVTRQLAENLSALSIKFKKPIAIVLELPLEERNFLMKNLNFPFFFEPIEAFHALATLHKCHLKKHHQAVHSEASTPLLPDGMKKWFSDMIHEKRQPLLHETFDLLDRAGIPTVSWRMAGNKEEAVEAAEKFGYPLALKAVAPSLVHKSDQGGISLNITDNQTLLKEYKRLNAISGDISGIMVQKMLPQSRELIIGGKNDPSFGPLILVGFGGILVEVIKDVQIRLAPIDMDTAKQMLTDLSGARLLGPFRGMQEADLDGIANIMVTVSKLMHEFPQIQEMDLNPVSIDNQGKRALAVDARIFISLP